MNRKLSPERNLRGLGDMTPDYGSQFPGQAQGMARQSAAYGYRGAPTSDELAAKFGREAVVGTGGLTTARDVDESTCFVGQSHPMQDVPFWGQPIHYSTGDSNILATVTQAFAVVTIPRMHVGFIRRIVPTLLTPGSDAVLRVTPIVDGSPFQGMVDIRPTALIDLGQYQNTYLRLMQGQSLVLSIRNDGLVAHTYRLSLFGWHYPVAKVIETARGVIPNDGV